jgi:hypothetical protein
MFCLNSRILYLVRFKSWFSKNLFLKKKTNLNEINFLNFLKFFFKTKKNIDYLLDNTYDDTNKDFLSQVIDLKKSFFLSIRENRKYSSNFLFKKTKTQTFLTKSFSTLKKKNKFIINLFGFSFLLLKSQLALTLVDSFFLIKNKLVYLNHNVLSFSSRFFIPKSGVFVSLLYHKNFYFTYFNFLKHTEKIKFKLFRKQLKIKKTFSNFYKQKTLNFSKKYNMFCQLIKPVPSYIEVDYFTLSFFFFFFSKSFVFFFSYFSFFFLKSLNWTKSS